MIPFFAFSQTGIFTGSIDFSKTLKDFQSSKAPAPGETLYALEGTAGEILIQNPDPASFTAVAEFLNAEWLDAKVILSYQAYLVFKGADLSEKILETRPKKATRDQVFPHRRILILAKYTGQQEVTPGVKAPVFKALYFRVID